MKRIAVMLMALSLVLVFAACTQASQEPRDTEPPATQAGPTVVATVDELLAALVPGADIQLGEGEFRLESASDYGETKGPYYIWNDLGGGEYELQLQYLDDVIIRGAGQDKTRLITAPRWANVLVLKDCWNVKLQDMTLGHRETTQACEGGVLYLSGSKDTTLEGVGLFGCGTVGVQAYECQGVVMEGCSVYDCSSCAVQVSSSEDVTIHNSTFHSLGGELPVFSVFAIWDAENVTVEDCRISDNYVYNLVNAGGRRIAFRNNLFEANRLPEAAFHFTTTGVVLEGNRFEENQLRSWYTAGRSPGVDGEGNEVVWEIEKAPVTPGVAEPVSTGEQKQVRVYTADDFLKAIAPDTCILLGTKNLDLSKAKDYGTSSSQYYYWEESHDGPSLVIREVKNLTIRADSEDRTAHTLSAVPRYANVLTFENCTAITLENFTAGHTPEAGYCSGGVFQLRGCDGVLVNNCGMFGCGTVGVDGINTRNLQIVNSEIYECSYAGISLSACDTVKISGTLIRDIGDEYLGKGPFFSFYDSANVTLDGAPIDGNYTGD